MSDFESLRLLRSRAAQAARDYQNGKISWTAFMDEFAGSEDETVAELVDLIEHEPKRGGVLGVNEKGWAEYQAQIEQAIEALRS